MERSENKKAKEKKRRKQQHLMNGKVHFRKTFCLTEKHQSIKIT